MKSFFILLIVLSFTVVAFSQSSDSICKSIQYSFEKVFFSDQVINQKQSVNFIFLDVNKGIKNVKVISSDSLIVSKQESIPGELKRHTIFRSMSRATVCVPVFFTSSNKELVSVSNDEFLRFISSYPGKDVIVTLVRPIIITLPVKRF